MQFSLTPKQQAVLTAIEEYIIREGHPPSYKELQEKLGYSSTASIWRFVSSLKAKGLLSSCRKWNSLCPQKTASTILPNSSSTFIPVDIIGHIFRDKPPVLWVNSTSIQLPSELVRHTQGCYGLIIEDAAYIDLHLLPHDLIIVDPKSEINPGELVLASNQGTIIGHLFEDGELLQFKSSPFATKNSREEGHRLTPDEIHMWGVIIASIRATQLLHTDH